MQPADKLVRMVNQIARNLAVRGEDHAVVAAADHIRKFWDPRMRATICAHLAKHDDDFLPIARRAVAIVAGDPADA